jgi:pimeloyl-ACP methyl ester carboxylesterase
MDVVRDLELIRRAMGEGRLNYIGFSYGTKIGALYADAYPLNVRAMVLDGVYPTSLSLLDLTLEQTAGFERSLQAFLMSCMQDSACPFGGGKPQEALTTLMASLKQQPIPAGSDRSLGYGEATYGVLLGLYAQEFWPLLERALAAAQAGDGRQLLALTDAYFMRSDQGVYPNAIDAFYAVTCTDSSPLNAAQVDEQIDAATRAYPFFGAMFINDMLYCTYWPAAPGLQPRTVSATGAPPIMVVGTTGDPATPYAWSQRLTNELDSSFLVTLEAQRHVAAGTDRCVDDRYRQYLRQPEAGFGDLLCGQDGSRGDD